MESYRPPAFHSSPLPSYWMSHPLRASVSGFQNGTSQFIGSIWTPCSQQRINLQKLGVLSMSVTRSSNLRITPVPPPISPKKSPGDVKPRTNRKDRALSSRSRRFRLIADHQPTGDQPNAIRFLTENLQAGRQFQTLHGVTGSGKTFIMANVIANVNRPTLVLAPNKTLAAQLYSEFARYFPHNAVEYFVSHFKHYQPEAYLPSSDKYIAKSSSVDKRIDRLRHAATKSLFERGDTIVVASVSSIYGLGLPSKYLHASFPVCLNQRFEGGVARFLDALRDLSYVETSLEKLYCTRGLFKHSDNVVEVSPPWEPEGTVYRFLFDGDCVVALQSVDTVSGNVTDFNPEVMIYPAKHFVTPKERLDAAICEIEREADECVAAFMRDGRPLEASRLQERVASDVDMIRKVGFCSGMENYSLFLSGRSVGDPPETLVDYMPKDRDWLLLVDESHVTVPQLGAMHAGNAARKRKLIRHGFRLPSSLENRPLSEQEFWDKAAQTVFVSATPSAFEIERSVPGGVAEAVIRPTGVVDPSVEVVGTRGQIEHLTKNLAGVVAQGGKAIVTTITKRFAEDLADCLSNKVPVAGVLDRQLRVAFLHSGIDSVGRMQVLEGMRDGSRSGGDELFGTEEKENYEGEYNESLDVVVGVNLLREGIDLPAVQLVAILDADSEGFLRGETALIQTIGRAARNINGHVVMYADTVTGAMRRAIAETKRRRRAQMAFNRLYQVDASPVDDVSVDGTGKEEWSVLNRIRKLDYVGRGRMADRPLKSGFPTVGERGVGAVAGKTAVDFGSAEDVQRRMLEAAEKQDFEMAALLRDRLSMLEAQS